MLLAHAGASCALLGKCDWIIAGDEANKKYQNSLNDLRSGNEFTSQQN